MKKEIVYMNFFINWFIVLFLNQILFYHACFHLYCLKAALVHTGIIAFLITYIVNKYDNESNIKKKLDFNEGKFKQKDKELENFYTEESYNTLFLNKQNVLVKEKQPQYKYKKLYKNIPIFLKSKGIKCLYHFTAIENIESIITNQGLYSWNGLQNKGIQSILLSNKLSRQLDKQKKLENYVRLSFTNYHPMSTKVKKEYSKQLVWLEIDLEVCLWDSTLFSNINATDNNVIIKNDFDFLKTIDFEVFKKRYNTLSGPEKKQYQAEILVKDFLPIEYIKNIDKL